MPIEDSASCSPKIKRRGTAQPVIVLLPGPMVEQLTDAAQAETISRSALIRQACRELLSKRGSEQGGN
jgi:metal-responsive CopG/Arc/MetJ family transcriptional regulator